MAVQIAGEAKLVASSLGAIEKEFIAAYNGLKGLVKGKGVMMARVNLTPPRNLLAIENPELFEGRLLGMISKARRHGIIPAGTEIHPEFHGYIDEMRAIRARYHSVPEVVEEAATQIAHAVAPVAEEAGGMYKKMGSFASLTSGPKIPLQQAESEFIDAYNGLQGYVKGMDKSMYLVNTQNPIQILHKSTPESFEGHLVGMIAKAEQHGVIRPGQESHQTFNSFIDRMRAAREKFLEEAQKVSVQQSLSGPTL